MRWLLGAGMLLSVNAALAAPVIFWASSPVGPDETCLLMGGGFGNSPVVEVGCVQNKAEGVPDTVERWTRVPALQVSAHSLKFVVPADFPKGMYACRVSTDGQTSAVHFLNGCEVWWWQGDGGETASLGGWLRCFGVCLSMSERSSIGLRALGAQVGLPVRQLDPWTVAVKLDSKFLAAREYEVVLYNGWGGKAGTCSLGKVTVTAPEQWKPEVFNVRDFGDDSDAAVHAALAKAEANGGGVVYFPRGRYQIKSELKLPPGTILRGEDMALVSLYWPDLDQPAQALIHGPKFGLENLSLYCQNHRNVVEDEDTSVGTFLRRVRIRANVYFMFEEPGIPYRGKQTPATHRKCGAAIQLRGRNFSVTDCDIYASNYAFSGLRAKYGVIARNTLLYGGRGYSIENADRLIFEDNLIAGNDLLAIGNDIHTFWTNACCHIYYARNRLQHMYGADREMMTLDAGGGAYFGQVAAVSGTHLTLAADPTPKDYAPPGRHTDWAGAACIILDGTGAGQWRWVTRNAGREWDVDRAWDIAPDDTSLLSIVPHRGRNLFIGNTFEDGGAFQLYGSGLDTIVAGNKGARMDGFFAWGLNPHDWGWQPCLNCQFLDNEILEGNGYGGRSAFIGAFTSNNNDKYAGPLARAMVFRRNICHNNARLRLGGTVDGAVIEHCTVRHSEQGVLIGKGPTNVLLRGNQFEDVAKPYDGEGMGEALIHPPPR